MLFVHVIAIRNAHTVAMVLTLLGEPKGLLIIVTQSPFSESDITTLKAAESQIDSAIAQAHAVAFFIHLC